MFDQSLIKTFIRPLSGLQMNYMITGSVASMLYGEPRMTHDIDLVLEMDASQIDRFISVFPPADFYCPPEEVIRVEIARNQRGHFNLIHHTSGYKADVYLRSDDPFHIWALKNIREIRADEEIVRLAPPEYVIVRKLDYYRESSHKKHLDDIMGMLRVIRNDVSFPSIDEWIHYYSLEKEWSLCRQ